MVVGTLDLDSKVDDMLTVHDPGRLENLDHFVLQAANEHFHRSWIHRYSVEKGGFPLVAGWRAKW